MWISNLSELELTEFYELTNFNIDPALNNLFLLPSFRHRRREGGRAKQRPGESNEATLTFY